MSPTDVTTTATYREIGQQPAVWRALHDILRDRREALDAFLEPLLARPDLRIVLTGAGTSAFVGETAAPALTGALHRRVEQVPTTTIVASPREAFAEDVPTLLVSFARSGNSPESIAATALADEVLTDAHHLLITCAADGELAVGHAERDDSFVLLMPPESLDDGFAMTSSFTAMLLAVLVAFGAGEAELLPRLADAAQDVIDTRQDDLRALAARGDTRRVYLGSGPLHGLAHEAALKTLELTAGDVLAYHESSLGFRHGPKALVDEKTLTVVFVSSEPYTRAYDLDIVAELRGDRGEDGVLALAATDTGEASAWVLPGLDGLPDAFAAAVYIVVAQYLALFTSGHLGKTPDNPFPSGDVNRVVQGVVIHDLS